LKYSLINSRCWARSWSKCWSTFLLADRFRGQVKLSDLLKVAGPRGRRILQPDVTTGVRRSLGG